MNIVATNLAEYRQKTEDYIEHLNDLGWNTPYQSVEFLIRDLLERSSVVVRTNADLNGRDSATFFAKDKHGKTVKVLLIDKKFQESVNANVYYKKYIVHELGHLILEHRTNRINGWSDRSLKDGAQETVDQEEHIENEAEAMGSVILFWPDARFQTLWNDTKDLNVIAKNFNAELDCCAKYILLRNFSPECHYIKYNVADRCFEDFSIPENYDPIFANSLNDLGVFISDDTALGTCVIRNAIGLRELVVSKNKTFNSYLTVQCKAYYRPKDKVSSIQEDDKVICIGHKI